MQTMKNIHLFIIQAALATAVLAGCKGSDDVLDMPQGTLPADGIIRIATGVNRLVETRAGTVTPYTGTTLGLYIRPTDSQTWETRMDETTDGSGIRNYTYANVKFTADGTTAVAWTSEYPLLWKGSGVEYEYYAYAPYVDSPADGSAVTEGIKAAFDLTTPQDQGEEAYDLLRATGSGLAENLVTVDGRLAVIFDHALCKVAVEIALADEFYQQGVTDNPIQKVSISTERISGTLDVLTGDIADVQPGTLDFPTDGAVHTAGSVTTDGSYTTPYLFYAPGEQPFTVEITTTDNRLFSYTYDKANAYLFESGNMYLIRLTMGNEVVQGGDISASEWNEEAAGGNGVLGTE